MIADSHLGPLINSSKLKWCQKSLMGFTQLLLFHWTQFCGCELTGFFNPVLNSQFCGESMSEKICHVQKHSSVSRYHLQDLDVIMRYVITCLCACEGENAG